MNKFAPISNCFLSLDAYPPFIMRQFLIPILTRGEERETHLVDTNGFTIEFDLIHDFTRIIRVLLGQELAKPISLMSH